MLFDKIYGKKQFKKTKIEEMRLDCNIVEKFAEKVTEKTISGIDSVGLLQYLVSNIDYPKTTVSDHFRYENECLGQVITVEPKADKRLYYTSSIKCTKSITIIELYEIFSGKTREVKMWTSQYNSNPFNVGDIIYIISLEKKHKKEPTGEINEKTGKKIYRDIPDKYEYWLSKFTIKDNIEVGDK